MANKRGDRYSAPEQGLGYLYQPRFALLQLLELPEETSVLIEKDDDLEFIDNTGRKSLGSLKHKAAGERLTDLATDFWRSVRIWLTRYEESGRMECTHRFYLFTTNEISSTSFLTMLLESAGPVSDVDELITQMDSALQKTKSQLIESVSTQLSLLNRPELRDFWKRVGIVGGVPRIEDIPGLIKDRHMRSIRRDYRRLYSSGLRAGGTTRFLSLLTGRRLDAIFGFEVSDKLSAFADEYKSDNLPITFRGTLPEGEIDADGDGRLFVRQLREIGISSTRIRNAILDYYRAYEQRSAWARENLLISGELEEYEDRLEDEWSRYRDVVFEKLSADAAETVLREAGQRLYQWADLESGNISSLRIRERVTEPYVVRGGFHILANSLPRGFTGTRPF